MMRSRDQRPEVQKGKWECQIECCDFRKFLPTLHDVDLILCDPPYAREYLDLFEPLSKLAAECLAPRGMLAVLYGQSNLPELYDALRTHLDYRWTMAMAMPGDAPTVFHKRVRPQWKPLLIFMRPGAKPVRWIYSDLINPAKVAKDLHPWQQEEGGIRRAVELLSQPNDLVVDCFLGTGTTGVAALETGRRFAGCDVDRKAVLITRKRLGLV
ncbi:MAG: site-specific DNA-methyltransferase [Deltaproteobacteria bacterium]|nr:site-specific DNA-methyltransferase [Deltaproteobacteria bacterium]